MTGNKAGSGGEGGAIYLGLGQLTVRDSVIADNLSQFNGSAVTIGSSLGQAAITNTIISGNRGPSGITNNGTLTLVNCTLAGNHGDDRYRHIHRRRWAQHCDQQRHLGQCSRDGVAGSL